MKPPIITTLTTLLVACSFSVFSQSDFRNGFIVTNDAKVINGLINYKGNKANAEVCEFKENKKSKTVTYGPNDIQSYQFVNGKYFVSLVPDTISRKRIFLEYLINGTVDIYYYRDAVGEHYFIDRGDNKLSELKNEDRVVNINGYAYKHKNNSYIGLLKLAFAKSPTISKKVESVELKHQSLIDIAKDYHNEVCSNEVCIIYEKKVSKAVFTWGPMLGLNQYSVKNSNTPIPDDYYYLRGTDFKPQTYLSYGFFLRQNLPSIHERFFYNVECTFHHRTFSTANPYKSYPTQTVYYINYIDYKQSTLNSVLTARYEYTKGSIKPSLHIGMFYDVLVASKYKRSTYQRVNDNETFTGASTDNPFASISFGVVGGCGMVIKVYKEKEILLDARYSYELNDFATVQLLKGSNISLLLRYTL